MFTISTCVDSLCEGKRIPSNCSLGFRNAFKLLMGYHSIIGRSSASRVRVRVGDAAAALSNCGFIRTWKRNQRYIKSNQSVQQTHIINHNLYPICYILKPASWLEEKSISPPTPRLQRYYAVLRLSPCKHDICVYQTWAEGLMHHMWNYQMNY